MFSLYVHIPWCRRKCPYCDFNVHVAARPPEHRYVEALRGELRHAAAEPAWRGRSLDTVFFGGGTPSLFAPESAAELLAEARALWPTSASLEVTLEANPEDASDAALRGFREAGVTRLSLGAQSLAAAPLRQLGREHRPDDVVAAVRAARDTAFASVSLDLIFAVPGQTPEDWERDLAAAADLGPDHLSTYSLTFEEGTPFHRSRAAGSLRAVAEEDEVAMMTAARTRLEAAGYGRYEISNYARPGKRCRHNSNCWSGIGYLGIGAGAHSFSPAGWGRRWSNERDPRRYMEAIESTGAAQVFAEELTREQAMGEWMFLRLRQSQGLDASEFARRFGCDLGERFPQLGDLVAADLLGSTARGYRLTPKGTLVADTVFAAFV